MNQFGLRLREMRTAAGLTQDELATAAGLTKAGIANLEQGRREPAWATVQALASALGATCEAFTAPPATGEKPGLGRPRKSDAEVQPPPEPPARRKGKK